MAIELGILGCFAENWQFSTKYIIHIMVKYVFDKVILLY